MERGSDRARETYDRGNGAVILLYNLYRRKVVLTRQFRYPAFVNGHDGMLIEAPAGLLDMATPEDRIKAEVEEETGYRVEQVRRIFEAFMSPGSVTEKLHFFVAAYDPGSRKTDGGGNVAEGEDIEVLELSIEDAMFAIESGRNCRRQNHHASAIRLHPSFCARWRCGLNAAQSLMILIAGPYRSGTGDDPELMAANLRSLESVALPLYRAGHLPLIGEWIALPLLA